MKLNDSFPSPFPFLFEFSPITEGGDGQYYTFTLPPSPFFFFLSPFFSLQIPFSFSFTDMGIKEEKMFGAVSLPPYFSFLSPPPLFSSHFGLKPKGF